MAEDVFADTQGWIALLNRSDQYHGSARRAMSAFKHERRHVVTTDWVLAETGNGLARTKARDKFVEAVRRMQKSPSVTIVKIDDDLFEQALQMFSRVSDKNWGLVDCASFVVMTGRGIIEAFSNDQHFEQAGFRRLL